MGILLSLEQLSFEWPAKKVVSDLSTGIYEGDRIGIVGGNGEGKSTLLELLSSKQTPDSGTITARNSLSIGMLGQSDELKDDDSVASAVFGDVPEYVWASDPKKRSIYEELIATLDLQKKVGELSGGQRRLCDLARVLLGDWDILLLDEPTNHLDMHAIRWLADHLKHRWPCGSGAFLIVTHDRWFLDEVCLSMWEINAGQLISFEGGYSAYIQQRFERQEKLELYEQKRQNILRKELNWLSHGAKARSSKPKFRIEAARALLSEDPPLRNTLELRRLAVARLGKQVIELKGVGVNFGEQTILKDINWIVGPGDRIGILGANGAGKTTLLRVATAALKPSSGFVKIGKTVHFGIMSQQLLELKAHDAQRLEDFLLDFKQQFYVDKKPQTPKQLAARLGFSQKDMPTHIKSLSGGQRRRLALLAVLLQEPNVLILDEPGNDLDTDMLAVIEDLLDSWPATLLLVTHDRYLMERVTDDQYALLAGNLVHMPAGVDEYLRRLDELKNLDHQKEHSKAASEPFDERGKKLGNKERHRLSQQLASLERKLEKKRLEEKLSDHKFKSCDPHDFEKLYACQQELDMAKAEVEQLEDEWLSIATRLEES